MGHSIKSKAHFPNLDGLRFLGALFILILHIEGFKNLYGKEVIGFIYYFHPLGALAVSLFFVLSGFLITYLLLKEKEDTSTIQLKNFYLRRILKIWPLYFLIGITGFFLLSKLSSYFYEDFSIEMNFYFWIGFFLYLLFLPPFVRSESIGPTWSVRVEEAFYLLWPIILRRGKNYFKVFAYPVFIILLVRNISAFLALEYPIPVFKLLVHLSEIYRVNCMVIGGIGAYLYIKDDKKILPFIYRKDVQWIVYVITIILLAFRVHIRIIHYEVYSVLFTCIVVNLATNPKSVVRLDYNWMNYLGKISYGLYLYNSITRVFCFEFVEYIFGKPLSGWQMEVVLYALCILSTISVATLSYEFFEKPFLKLKTRFEVVKTKT